MLRTVICIRIDNHQYDELMEYLERNSSTFSISDLNDVIRWANENPRDFKGKSEKYYEMLRIAKMKCDEAQSIEC